MNDLHTRLVAAVNARLEVARAATPGPWTWTGDYPDGHCPHSTEWTDHGPDLAAGEEYVITSGGYDSSSLDISDADAAFIAANDPATAIRYCERDLRVLERHAPLTTPAGIACDHCERLCHSQSGLGCESPDAPWPCDEIRDLATAYGVEVDDA